MEALGTIEFKLKANFLVHPDTPGAIWALGMKVPHGKYSMRTPSNFTLMTYIWPEDNQIYLEAIADEHIVKRAEPMVHVNSKVDPVGMWFTAKKECTPTGEGR